MIKKLNKKSVRSSVFFAVMAIMITIVFVTVGSYIQEGFDIAIGDVSPRTFKATRQIENRVATNRLRQEARATVGTAYMRLPEVEGIVEAKLDNLFLAVEELRNINKPAEPPTTIIDRPTDADTNGLDDYQASDDIIYEDGYAPAEVVEPPAQAIRLEQRIINRSQALASLSTEQLEYLVVLDPSHFNHFRASLYEIFRTTIENDVRVDDYLTWEPEIIHAFLMRTNSEALAMMG